MINECENDKSERKNERLRAREENMKRLLLFVLSLALVTIAVSGYAFAEPNKAEPWQTAFLHVLTEKRQERSANTGPENGIDSYALYDIDRDGIPELFLRSGIDTAGSKCLLYRFNGDSASFVDEFYFGASELYSTPERDGVLLVYQHMFHAKGQILTLADDGLHSTLCFEEYVEPGEWYHPVSNFCPGAAAITEFRYDQDYPLLSYNTWSQPAPSAGETHYPNGNPNFFTDLFIDNTEVVKVRFPEALFFLPGNETETMGIRDLQELLLHNPLFGSSTSENEGEFESAVADLNNDGQLEFVLSFQTTEGDYTSHPFMMILSEQDGTVYCYVDELHAFTSVSDTGVFYRYENNYGIVTEYTYRVFFDGENCMRVACINK